MRAGAAGLAGGAPSFVSAACTAQALVKLLVRPAYDTVSVRCCFACDTDAGVHPHMQVVDDSGTLARAGPLEQETLAWGNKARQLHPGHTKQE